MNGIRTMHPLAIDGHLFGAALLCAPFIIGVIVLLALRLRSEDRAEREENLGAMVEVGRLGFISPHAFSDHLVAAEDHKHTHRADSLTESGSSPGSCLRCPRRFS